MAPSNLIHISGVVDVRDERGWVRTDGYLPGSEDAYLPLNLIKQHGLRRGDVIEGRASAPDSKTHAPGNRARRPAVTTVESVNGLAADAAKKRPDFYSLTPLFPTERLRLETEPQVLTTRMIDLLSPIGKGQRALVVSPPKAGKTMVLQDIARAVSANHPDAYLMAILVDERPEEVTDMRRTLHGEVVASTFDRPPADHIAVAELAIERAKRLVETGQDVVVLLDSITRLGRAYNLAAPGNSRVLTGGIAAGALQGPKRFLGAARNLEGGGSLTIIATALVETGSAGDTVIFEEFKSTGNAELRLLRSLAERRIFPAVDVETSGTRREELLLAPEELILVQRLRRALHAMDPQQAGEQLVERLRKTSSNAEFLLNLEQAGR